MCVCAEAGSGWVGQWSGSAGMCSGSGKECKSVPTGASQGGNSTQWSTCKYMQNNIIHVFYLFFVIYK